MNMAVQFGNFNGPFAARALQLGVEAFVPSGGGAGGGAGKASFDNIGIEKQVDGYSPLLYMLSASGQQVERVQIALHDAAGNPSGSIVLYGVRVLSCRSTFQAGDITPMESLSLNYGKIEMDMYGSKFGWDVMGNKKL